MKHTIQTSAICTALVSAAMIATGCSDEPIRDGKDISTAVIGFNANVTDNSRAITRSGEDARMFQSPVSVENLSSGDSVYLHPAISDFPEYAEETATRSTTITSSDNLYDKFPVSAYHYTGEWDDSQLAKDPNYFVMQSAVRSGGTYRFSPDRYWPNEGKMRFIAHAPAGDNAFTFYAHDDANRGPRVHINIADKVENQNDLLVAYTAEVACNGQNGTTPLNFKHALTGIRFVCDKTLPKSVITNVTIKGVRYEGDFFFNPGDASESSTPDTPIDSHFNAWETYDKVFSLDLNQQVNGSDNEEITAGENTFLMFPQTLPDGATVEITLQRLDSKGNLTDEKDVISGSIAGRIWPAGKIVTYKISSSAQVLQVEEPSVFNYLGHVYNASDDTFATSNSIKVASFAGNNNMKWKVEYMDSGSSGWSPTSSWLSIDPSWAWSDAAEQDVRFVAKSIYNSVDIDANLKKETQKGTSASPYNLSNSSGGSAIETTANSYIVNAPGYYILPLVYGNAIQDGQTNVKSYNYSGGSGKYILDKFVNHLGNAITSPYIADNSGCTPTKASIVWQDAQNLVQNVEYVASAFGGKGGIKFYVSQGNIKQGNAVISIADNSNIMWSWHIWATDFKGFDDTVDVTNGDGNTFTLMPLNLGWCSNGEIIRYYPRRECKVRFTPTEGDQTISAEVTFVELPHTSIPFGNNPYYQWGRKDPFIGSNIAWGNKEHWDGNGTYYGTGSENNPPRLFSDLVEDAEKRLTTIQCLNLLIQNPDKWHNPPAVAGGTSYVTTNEIYTNLWGENSIGDNKTVYDPCPPGYQVNYYYAYTGFLDPGYNWASDKGIEFVKETATDWDSSNLAEFYTDKTKLNSITFPVSGYRDWNNKAEVTDFKVRGFIWMRGTEDEHDSYMFRFAPHIAGAANVAPVTKFFSTDGLPIRPAKL